MTKRVNKCVNYDLSNYTIELKINVYRSISYNKITITTYLFSRFIFTPAAFSIRSGAVLFSTVLLTNNLTALDYKVLL